MKTFSTTYYSNRSEKFSYPTKLHIFHFTFRIKSITRQLNESFSLVVYKTKLILEKVYQFLLVFR